MDDLEVIEWIALLTMLPKKYTDLLPWVGFLLGGVLRFMPGMMAAFPVNDGGMLLAMARDLRSNEFVLPFVTSYNFLGIPFVYPPLGMYIVAFLSDKLPIPDIELLLWLPPILSTAIIPAFYWLAYRILNSESKAAIATLFYALMPGSSDWLIMGGGLTRSLGILFSLFAVGYIYDLFRNDRSKTTIGLSILFCALAVLSHPEVGAQTAGICFMFWAFYGKNSIGIRNAILVSLGTALLSAPWWLTVLLYHGFSPFWSAMHTGIRETMLASLFHTFFSTQGGLPILSLFWLVGMFAVLRKREFLLILWAFLPFVVDARNAPAIAIFPFLMLVSDGACYLSEELIRAYSVTFPNHKNAGRYLTVLAKASLAIVLFYLLFISYRSVPSLVAVSLSHSDRETMEWIKENTPPKSRFLLITNRGDISPMTDSYQEWFPVLAERQSQNTLQGLEWTLDSNFFQYSRDLIALQACPEVDCLNNWLEKKNARADFILFQKKHASPALLDSLRSDESYNVVYQSSDAEIFALHP